MRDRLDELFSRDAIFDREWKVKLHLFGLPQRDQRRARNQAAVALRELLALPHVAEEDVVGEIDELRSEITEGLPNCTGWLLRITHVASSGSFTVRRTRQHFERGRAWSCTEHGAQVGASLVLRSIGAIDAVVGRPVDRFEGDIVRDAAGADSACLLSSGVLVPARLLPVVPAHIESIVDRDGPDGR